MTNYEQSVPKQAELAEQPNGTYNTIIATYKTMQRSISAMLAEEGLTQPQFYALRVIAKNGPMPMKGISDEMLVTPANVTGIVDRLESKGLIRRTAGPVDRRTNIIELTAEGRAVQERVAARYSASMQRALRAFTTDEQKTLRYLLVKLRKEMSV